MTVTIPKQLAVKPVGAPSADVFLTTKGHFEVTITHGTDDMWQDIQTAFTVVETTPSIVRERVAELVLDADKISVFPWFSAPKNVVKICRYIVQRFNSWLKKNDQQHSPWSSQASLHLKDDAVRKNARKLTEIGAFFCINNRLNVWFNASPKHPSLEKLSVYLQENPVFFDKVVPAFTVYAESVTGGLCVGCDNKENKKEITQFRQTCATAIEAFNKIYGERVKILVNVCIVRPYGGNFGIERISFSDDYSCFVKHALLFLEDEVCTEKEHTAWVYVDQIGCVYFHYSTDSPIEELLKQKRTDEFQIESPSTSLAPVVQDVPAIPTVVDQAVPATPTVVDQATPIFVDQATPIIVDQAVPTTPTVVDQAVPTTPAVVDQATPATPTVVDQGAPTGVDTRFLASVFVTIRGNYQVVGAANQGDITLDIVDTFSQFKTTPLSSHTHVVDLHLDASNNIIVVDANSPEHVADIIIACHWIVNRFNTWPKAIYDIHRPKTSEPSLRLKKKALVNAKTLITVGTLSAIHGRLVFELYFDVAVPAGCLEMIGLLEKHHIVVENNAPSFYVYIDQLDSHIYIGCKLGSLKRDAFRVACAKAAQLYNETHGVKIKLLSNVGNLVVSDKTISVGRVANSDDCSCLITSGLTHLTRTPIGPGAPHQKAWVYVDRVGQVYICCDLPGGELEKMLRPDVKTQPATKSTPLATPSVPPKTITEKNKQDDIDLFFADIGDRAAVDWNAKLKEAVTSQPAHVVEHIFVRAADRIKMSMKDKVGLLEVCMKKERVDTARVLLDRFNMDADSMAHSGIKWGEWVHNNPKFCRELIERFDLPRSAVFATFPEILEIRQLGTLGWLVDHYHLDTHQCKPSSAVYCIIRDKLYQGSADMFATYVQIFSSVVTKQFVPEYINDKHDANLLMDCLISGRVSQFDCLVKHFQINKGTIQSLFKCMVADFPAGYWDPNILKHVLDLTL